MWNSLPQVPGHVVESKVLKMSFNLKNDLIYCGRTLNLNLIIRSLPRTAPTHQMLEDITRSWT